MKATNRTVPKVHMLRVARMSGTLVHASTRTEDIVTSMLTMSTDFPSWQVDTMHHTAQLARKGSRHVITIRYHRMDWLYSSKKNPHAHESLPE